MPLTCRPLVVLACIFFAWPAWGARPNLLFTHYGKDQGLAQSSVNCLYQDRQGMLWICTFGGINRFDGYEMRVWANDFDDPSSLPDNSVWTALEDSGGRLWFGTKAGLALMDRSSGAFTTFAVDVAGSERQVAVKALLELADGRLLVGTEGHGLFALDAELAGGLRPIPGLGGLKVSALAEQPDGTVWIGTEGDGLLSLGAEGVVTRHRQPGAERPSAASIVWSLLVDRDGSLWVGTDGHGLLHLPPSGERFRALADRQAWLSGLKIKSLEKDERGRLWIGSATDGLAVLDLATEELHTWAVDPGDRAHPSDADISAIVAGTNGVVWVGYYMKGFDRAIETPFRVLRADPDDPGALAHDVVYSMHAEPDGTLWLGSFGGGLDILDPATGAIENHRHDPDDPTSISHDWVRYIYRTPRGQHWIGTWGGGLNHFDRARRRFTRYLPDPDDERSLGMAIVTTIFEDSEQRLWVGTYGEGFSLYHPESDDFSHYRHDPSDPDSLSDDHITAIYEWQPGVLWICTYGGGINRWHTATDRFERIVVDRSDPHSLNNMKVLHMYPDGDSFWVTTLGGGLNRFHPASRRFEHWTTAQGLADNTTMGILRSADGHLWIGTNTGLARFDPATETFTNYRVADGLASDDFNLEAYAQGADGTMYLGSKRGLLAFDPAAVVPQSSFPEVAFTRVEVEGAAVVPAGQALEIRYRDRVAFEFAAVNPAKPDRVRYRYRLQGFEEGWNELDERRAVSFRSLPPGHYRLLVRSTNSSGIWSPDTVALPFEILAPWYRTRTFLSATAVLLILGAFFLYRWRVASLERRQRVLEATVAARTLEISEKSASLERALDEVQRLESFKRELTGMVVHDLKNPLASILGFSSGEPSGRNMGRIQTAGQRMLTLIENMLDIQRFESATVDLTPRVVGLAELVARALEAAESTARDRRIRLENEVDVSLDVQADPELVERTLVNLVGNAVKFSPPGSSVRVAAVHRRRRGEVSVSVIDQGQGIPPELHERIFERFVQVEARDLGAARSSGLGLTFCRLAVEAHGGTIAVDSTPGEGSTFSFTLPYAGASQRSAPAGAAPAAPPDAELTDGDRAALGDLVAIARQLTLYETGDWYTILEAADGSSRPALELWASRMRNALIQFDMAGFEQLKAELLVGRVEAPDLSAPPVVEATDA